MPMLIKRISLQNFKSFHANQSITVGQKNLIIGKNGSGKSNLLTALYNLFLFGIEKRPQYNNNEEVSSIEVEVDNSDRRFLLPTTFILKAVYKAGPEFVTFIVNDKPISKEELRGLLENAGFTQECFVMQGKVNDIALMDSKERHKLLCRIAGVEKYEDTKAIAISLLNEENEDKIEALIEKIELKMKISEEYKKKVEEYDNLTKMKTEAEFELLNHELQGLNEEIDAIEIGQGIKADEQNEGLIEFEIKATKEEMDRLAFKISECEEFLSKFDQDIVSQLRVKNNELIDKQAKNKQFIDKQGKNNEFIDDSRFNQSMNSQSVNTNHALDNINPYEHKTNVLEKAYKDTLDKLAEEERKEKEKYIELQALKFLDAMPVDNSSSIKSIEEQVKEKRIEIANFSNNKESNSVSYKTLISKRKQLWIKERQIKEELKAVEESEKNSENKMLYLGKASINIYESLKNNSGVIGPVFSLFEIPDNLLDAFEAVTRNSLFWIVVEDDEVATKLVKTVEGRVTFVALNRIDKRNVDNCIEKGIKNSNNTPVKTLAESIECESKYKDLLQMICKNFYIFDKKFANTPIEMSEKYNVVTQEGDIFNKNGSITGGFENSYQILRELKKCKKIRENLKKELLEISNQILNLNEKIKYTELGSVDDTRILENLLAFEKFLLWKIELLKHKKISVPDISELEMIHKGIFDKIPKIRLELESIENQLIRTSEKKSKIDEIIEKIQCIESSRIELSFLKNSEKSLIDSLYLKKANENIEESGKLQRKHHLIDKRTQLMRRIGITDFKALFIKNPTDSLISILKETNKKLKKYAGFSKRELLDDQRTEMRKRLEELRISKSKILDFIKMLDQKKEDTLNLSFSMISENYSYFFKKITGKSSTLNLGNKIIEISMDGKVCDLQSMSGGQKTVVALSIIFAIQKNDPSPFYVFDEIDANLDLEYCMKLSEIIKESDSQYFISSFKPVMIDGCDKYFGVISKDKESFVGEIDQKLAHETISI